tara:strand:+ start:1103 stop:1840 length:738 start_codon:yes stop_codon:yes gene_type:complete
MNKKNAIVIIDIGRKSSNNILQYNLKSFEYYSKRTGADLIILDTTQLDQKYNLKLQLPYDYIRFEKNQIYDLFNKYDRILRLDNDTIITKNCPNYFELDPSKFYVTREDVGSKREQRLKQIQTIQAQLGIIQGWDDFYFNSGVILASRIHKEAFNLSNVDLKKVSGSHQEQSVLNWLTFYFKFNIVDLGPYFNLMNFLIQEKFGEKKYANILHYAGKEYSEKVMALKKDIANLDLKFKSINPKLI